MKIPNLKYSLKIWMTSVLFSPLLLLASQVFIRMDEFKGFSEVLGFWVVVILYGTVLSLPALVLFVCLNEMSLQMDMKIKKTKMWISISAFGITTILFLLLFGKHESLFHPFIWKFIFSYSMPLICGIWFFKTKEEKGSTDLFSTSYKT